MILYNVTYNVQKEVEAEWIQYMKEAYVPIMLKTGYFNDNKILKLLNEEYGEGGTTYSFQYTIEEITDLEDFMESYESSIEAILHKKFGGKYVFFKTWLEEI